MKESSGTEIEDLQRGSTVFIEEGICTGDTLLGTQSEVGDLIEVEMQNERTMGWR